MADIPFLDFIGDDDHLIDHDALDIDEQFAPQPRVHPHLVDYGNPMEILTDLEFVKDYHMSKEVVRDMLLPLLQNDADPRGAPVPPTLMGLTLLSYLATSSFQNMCGKIVKLSQPTVCKIVNMTSKTLALKMSDFIKFPPPNQMNDIHVQFYALARFPGVTGIIDGTHIPIMNPGGPRAETFRNRKGTMSLNVQVVCGPNMEFFDLICRWPGSAHDSRMFNASSVKLRFDNDELPGYLLGDSGYAQTRKMYTPFPDPANPQEEAYNRAQKTTRNLIERAFGVWKRKFPILKRALQNKLPNSINIIIASAILHNMTRQDNAMYEPQEEEEEEERGEEEEDVDHPRVDPNGADIRRRFAQQFFG
ncbi:hypothetical protein M8J77_006645 [Diaphorina citri]|nr:hypothetical protein M8J77_006645 [Diaphorina citri]